MIKQIAHLCLQAKNLEKTVEFYKKAFGFKVKFKFVNKKKVFGYYLGCGKNTFIEIFENKKLKCTSEEGPMRHLCLETPSIKGLDARLNKLKIKHTKPVLGADYSWQLWVEDPNGVRIEFHQYTGRSLQMTGGDCVVSW